ncbi:hypothetical protein ACFVVU_23535 [Kitasatospora sp. NPDC057965]|uniref:hypothetical protein n=1 Tax=Kitasatospora sp. NPDC057965 TaxID=3346291 RepID=UPI0036DA3517
MTQPHYEVRTKQFVPGSTAYLRRRPCIWVSTTDTTTDDDVDLVAVERAANGQEPIPPLNVAEQRLAVHFMWRAGISYNDMAARAGIVQRKVARWVAKEKAAEGAAA